MVEKKVTPKLVHYKKHEHRLAIRRNAALKFAPIIAEKILEGYSPAYACSKFAGFQWADFREDLLKIDYLADAWAVHLDRVYKKVSYES